MNFGNILSRGCITRSIKEKRTGCILPRLDKLDRCVQPPGVATYPTSVWFGRKLTTNILVEMAQNLKSKI